MERVELDGRESSSEISPYATSDCWHLAGAIVETFSCSLRALNSPELQQSCNDLEAASDGIPLGLVAKPNQLREEVIRRFGSEREFRFPRAVRGLCE